MKHYYTTGNNGGGVRVYAFRNIKSRDHFVAWATTYDQRSAITRDQALKYSNTAIILGGVDYPDKEISIKGTK